MNTRLVLLPTLAALLLLSACDYYSATVSGSGTVVTETRTIPFFQDVDFSGVGEVDITQLAAAPSTGTTPALSVTTLSLEADDNLLPYLETYVTGSRLIIRTRPDINIRPSSTPRFHLNTRELNTLDVSGAGSITIPALRTTDFHLDLSGVGKIEIRDLNAKSLNVGLSGAGSVDIAGNVTTQKIELSGVASYSARRLHAQDSTISLSGAGSATLWSEVSLDASVSGTGSISYLGSPKVTSEVSGVGTINHLPH